MIKSRNSRNYLIFKYFIYIHKHYNIISLISKQINHNIKNRLYFNFIVPNNNKGYILNTHKNIKE